MFFRKEREIQKLKAIKKDLENQLESTQYFRRIVEHNNEILLNNAIENRAKIIDLENNIEFLYNNLTAKKKELVRPSNQN